MSQLTADALGILQDVLSDLDNPKASIAAAVRKLARAAALCSEHSTEIWCKIQLGDAKYTEPLTRHIAARIKAGDALKLLKQAEKEKREPTAEELANFGPAGKEYEASLNKLTGLGIGEGHLDLEELNLKRKESSGGYLGIEFVEQRIKDIERKKHMNDGLFFLTTLTSHAAFVRRRAHEKAAALDKKLRYIESPITAFDVLKSGVEDRLLERFPAAAERLMTAFVRVASPSAEEWSQALTSCRRFIEALADGLFPAQDAKVNGRDVSHTAYLNRLWAFIDKSLESETDRELAKRHLEFLGFYLEKVYKKTNQGVHADVDQKSAVICVFHCYLLAGAMLDHLEPKLASTNSLLDLSSASLDEMESVLGISRKVAKEIVKLRVGRKLTDQLLRTVPGLSPRTFERIRVLVRY